MPVLLLVSIFVVATCGLIYELVAGTLASYLLGDSVTQFSTIIGTYLFAMGIGSFFSKFIQRHLFDTFIRVEILIGFIGGNSAAVLFLLFEQVSSFRFLLYFLVLLTGVLVGLEIPLLMRILEKKLDFKDLVAEVFTFDYIGALLASVVFPLVFIPHLGLIRTAYFFGILNVLVALWVCFRFQQELAKPLMLKIAAFIILAVLLTGFVFSDTLTQWAETFTYQDKIIFTKTSLYQRIVLTRNGKDFKLFLNGNLQFSSVDEYRYHEALVHPPLQIFGKPEKVLVLGGGDGLAVREILKYESVQSVTLVDLDPEMTGLFMKNSLLTEFNKKSLLSPKVKVINADALVWLKSNTTTFDCILVDFPDPSNFSLGKLYTYSFYQLVNQSLSEKGIVVIQSTSPYVAPKSFWCVNHTLKAAGFHTLSYHVYVPSFGEWGYVMGRKNAGFTFPEYFKNDLRFVTPTTFREMTDFPKDMAEVPTAVNRLNNQILVHYFEEEWYNGK